MNKLNHAKTAVVLLTGIGGGGHGEQILKALRLSSNDYFIIGTDISEFSSNQSLVDKFYKIPGTNHPDYLETLLSIIKSHGVNCLIHGSEQELKFFSKHRQIFQDMGIYLPINPANVIDICLDKYKTMEFLKENGFKVPLFLKISKIEELENFSEFPAIIKPSINGGGSANVFIVQTKEELRTFATYLLSIHPYFLIQEYIGSYENEFTVGVLYDSNSNFINSIAVKRVISNALSVRVRVPNNSAKKELGESLVISSGVSQGIIDKWPIVTEQCEKIAEKLKPTAPINIQCRLVDGIVIPFEINPRFSGTTSLRAMVGYNEPDILIRQQIFGEVVNPNFEFRRATIMRSLEEFKVA